jgi:glycosyltransferase involved in cell wall biosynthesis
MTTISIAMATYNGARFIREQLESIAAQTFLPSELVITDDGSSDDTLGIIADFAKTAPFPVRVHRNEHRLGYRANFMKCVTYCSSEYVSFCDQDDIWDKSKLRLVADEFSRSEDILLVYHNAIVFRDDQELGPLYASEQIAATGDAANVGFAPFGFSMTFKKCLARFGDLRELSRDPNDANNCEAHDQWYYFLGTSLGKVSFIPVALVRYRQHAQNVYGWGRSHLVSKLIRNLRLSSVRQDYLCSCTRQRQRALAQIRLAPDIQSFKNLEQSLELYRHLSALMRLRKRAYFAPEMAQRAGAMWALIRHDAYSRNKQGVSFGARGALKDALMGIPFGAKSSRGM